MKYRRKIFLEDKIIERLKQITKKVSGDFGVEIVNQETDKDHIHILFKSNPKNRFD